MAKHLLKLSENKQFVAVAVPECGLVKRKKSMKKIKSVQSIGIDRAKQKKKKRKVDVIVYVVGVVVRDSVVNRCFNMLNVFRNLEQSRRK